jgi:hypothetical protein
LHWLQDPSQINEDNQKNIRHETSRHFRNKKREYLTDEIDELTMNSKNKNIRHLYRGKNDLRGVTNLAVTTYVVDTVLLKNLLTKYPYRLKQ